MTAGQTFALISWSLGLPVAFVLAVLETRDQARNPRMSINDDSPPGLLFIMLWLIAPLVQAGLLAFGVIWLCDAAVKRVAKTDRLPEVVARRTEELERETGL